MLERDDGKRERDDGKIERDDGKREKERRKGVHTSGVNGAIPHLSASTHSESVPQICKLRALSPHYIGERKDTRPIT